MLLIGAVSSLPEALVGIADEVRVHFPWGSLLAGCLGEDTDVLGSLRQLMRADATLTVLLSVVERDGLGGDIDERRLAVIGSTYASAGLSVVELRPARPDDVAEARSSWGKRLDVGRSRPGLCLRARRS